MLNLAKSKSVLLFFLNLRIPDPFLNTVDQWVSPLTPFGSHPE